MATSHIHISLQPRRRLLSLACITMLTWILGCKTQDPTPENVPELITKTILTFTPATGPAVVVTATDPDNLGAQDVKVDGPINLLKGTDYTLTIVLINGLYEPTQPGYYVSDLVKAEGDEHQFFFAWTQGIFSDPVGDGNIDQPGDPLNYGTSVDENGRPLGLTTNWSSVATTSAGSNSFRILLKHQPGLKSSLSTAGDGVSDLDITFVVSVN